MKPNESDMAIKHFKSIYKSLYYKRTCVLALSEILILNYFCVVYLWCLYLLTCLYDMLFFTMSHPLC